MLVVDSFHDIESSCPPAQRTQLLEARVEIEKSFGIGLQNMEEDIPEVTARLRIRFKRNRSPRRNSYSHVKNMSIFTQYLAIIWLTFFLDLSTLIIFDHI